MVKCILVHCDLALGSQLDKPKFSDDGGRDPRGADKKEKRNSLKKREIPQQDEPGRASDSAKSLHLKISFYRSLPFCLLVFLYPCPKLFLFRFDPLFSLLSFVPSLLSSFSPSIFTMDENYFQWLTLECLVWVISNTSAAFLVLASLLDRMIIHTNSPAMTKQIAL